MFISSLVFALAVAQSGGSVGAKRDIFVTCLKKELVASLDDQVEPAKFRPEFDGKCQEQQSDYRTAMVSEDIRMGSSKADAEEFANEEVSYLRQRYQDDYQGYFDNNDRPVAD